LLEAIGYRVEQVNHGAGEYARGDVHENTAECEIGLLQQFLLAHRGISMATLPSYLKLHQFRRNEGERPYWEQACLLLAALMGQYACREYVGRLEGAGAQISMAAAGTPLENAQAESFMRTLKREEVYLNDYQDFLEAEGSIGRFIEEVYDQKRLHSALGYRPPSEFEELLAAGIRP
jgi:transposase InsO family protein